MADPEKPSDRKPDAPAPPEDPAEDEGGDTYELADDPVPRPPAEPKRTGDVGEDAGEEETYELAEEPESKDSTKPAPPAGAAASTSAAEQTPSAKAPRRGKAEAKDRAQAKASAKSKAKAESKSKAGSKPPRESTEEQAPPSAEQPMRDKSGKPLPKQWSTEEPAFVDPELARQRREEQRKRAAEEEAIRAAKATRIKLIVLAVLLAIAAAVAVYFGLG